MFIHCLENACGYLGLLLGMVLLGTTPNGWAQDASSSSPSLDSLQQQWAELDAQLAKKQAAMDSGEGDLKVQRQEFLSLVDQANALIKKIKTTALAEIKKDPNNHKAYRAIMGILLHEAQQGQDADVLAVGDTLIANHIHPLYFETAAKTDRLSIDAREIFEELLIRQREAEANDLPRVKLTTTEGDLIVELYEDQAPNTVANFISLVESGYFDDRLFHRVIDGFMAQAGKIKSDGSGRDSLGYTIACECDSPEARPHFSHCLSMAHAGKDTGGGQFFITFERTDQLDGKHTCFGRVIQNAQTLDKIKRTHLIVNGKETEIPNVEKTKIIHAEVLRKRNHPYVPQKMGASKKEPQNLDEKPPADPNLSGPDDPADDAPSEKDDATDSPPTTPERSDGDQPQKDDGTE